MTLSVQTRGAGPDLVLLHGWALNSAVWDTIAPPLAAHYRVTLIDLPGHGQSGLHGKFELANVTQQLLDAAPKNAHWLGWSLGGMFALNAALLAPERVRSLITVATNARFTATADWPGVQPAVFDQFAENLRKDFDGTLARFLSLQVHHAEHSRTTLRALRQNIFARGRPDPAVLNEGLDILKHTDLRPELARVACPSLLLFGALDAQTTAKAAQQMCALFAQGRYHIFPKAAHAPFLSHPAEFLAQVTHFLGQQPA